MNHEALHRWAHTASILTFIIALIGAAVGIWGYFRSQWVLCQKSKRLKQFLYNEKMKGQDRGQRSILRIVRDVGLTQDEIIQISFRNPKVRRRVAVDEVTDLARELLFEYDPDGQ